MTRLAAVVSDRFIVDMPTQLVLHANRRLRVHQTAFSGLLPLFAWAMQGCLGIVGLGAVGIDMARTSEIEFQSFENSWVIEPQHLGSMKSIAVMPFAGDSVMADRWTTVLRAMTDLRVVPPSDATGYGVSAHAQSGTAQRMNAESRVDCVLIGNVVGQEPKKSFMGLKETASMRLYLDLVNESGTLMWRTELPYTFVKGAKKLDEEMVTNDLLAHVKAHANELGLAELQATTMQAGSDSLLEASDKQMAHP